MERRLQILQHLYGEAEDGAEFRRRLREDEALWDEYQALTEVKFRLDHRRRHRPDTSVVDQVVAAAARDDGTPQLGRRRDRDALPGRMTLRRRAVGVAGAVLAVLLMLGVGLWQFLPLTSPTSSAVAEEAVSSQEASKAGSMQAADASPVVQHLMSPLQRVQRPGLASLQAGSTGNGAAALPAQGMNAALSWDEASNTRRIQERIQLLRSRSSDLVWEEPAVPLEMPPSITDPDQASLLYQASHRQPPW